ncbi:MAG: hypothetical protein IJQ27_00935, partial [Spirochaetia bacterium]|nr:hypothetical protein [Spirochaetia bacterium]
MEKRKESAIKELAMFYPRLPAGLITMLLTAAAGIALAVIVVYPLWSTAIHSKAAYNWFFLLCVVLALVIIPTVRIRGLKKSGLSAGDIVRHHILPVLVHLIYI